MRAKELKNRAASERQRLLNLARERGEEFQILLSEFALERILDRLSRSRYAGEFILKGASLIRIWSAERHRATWDLDLLGRTASSPEEMTEIVREVLSVPAEDGLEFDLATVAAEEIMAGREAVGVRLTLQAVLTSARIPVQIDVGFGDVVVPPPEESEYPTLLEHTPPKLLMYPPEAVVAEKFQAMVRLGMANSRLKDIYDVYSIASGMAFDGLRLVAAIRATFEGRGLEIPGASGEEPIVFSRRFLEAPQRAGQWRAFLRRSRLDAAPESIDELMELIRGFLMPPCQALIAGEEFSSQWPPGGLWKEPEDA